MGFRLTFEMDLFNGPEQQAMSDKVLQRMLDTLYTVNCLYLEAHPEAPSIYAPNLITKKPRIHYQQEEPGCEVWQDIPTTIALGQGDCEDLACWRAAELTVREKIVAKPIFTVKKRKNGGMLYHIVVQLPDGTREDPSRKLGM